MIIKNAFFLLRKKGEKPSTQKLKIKIKTLL
jgi:hypothetical protein